MNQGILDEVQTHASETSLNYISKATSALRSSSSVATDDDWDVSKDGGNWVHLFESRLSPEKDSVTILYNHEEFVSHLTRLEIEAILSGE